MKSNHRRTLAWQKQLHLASKRSYSTQAPWKQKYYLVAIQISDDNTQEHVGQGEMRYTQVTPAIPDEFP